VTCLMVSHSTSFLDDVCTDIIHYEEQKLVPYVGNLSAFVAKVSPPSLPPSLPPSCPPARPLCAASTRTRALTSSLPPSLPPSLPQRPDAKHYYELSTETLRFNFPAPGRLDGVNSRTQTILKMEHVTFTYPGASRPQLVSFRRWLFFICLVRPPSLPPSCLPLFFWGGGRGLLGR